MGEPESGIRTDSGEQSLATGAEEMLGIHGNRFPAVSCDMQTATLN
jgi:hypothetical protein